MVNRLLRPWGGLLLGLVVWGGCPQQPRHRGVATSTAPATFRTETLELSFALDAGQRVRLGAQANIPDDDEQKRPALLFVPAKRRASRAGIEPGDGIHRYPHPVATTRQWATAFAEAGFLTLAFDHRGCTPTDDAECRTNPTDDVDQAGPQALARDVDAACAWLAGHPAFDGRVVLFAHGQAVGPALTSACAQRAAGLVLAAPIPRRVDAVMVSSIRAREQDLRRPRQNDESVAQWQQRAAEAARLKNEAASLEATFASLARGAFAEGARIWGATLPFWQGWIALTDATATRLKALQAPRVLVVGASDQQFAPADHRRIRQLADAPGVRFLSVDGADHHLLTEAKLSPTTRQQVLEAVKRMLGLPKTATAGPQT